LLIYLPLSENSRTYLLVDEKPGKAMGGEGGEREKGKREKGERPPHNDGALTILTFSPLPLFHLKQCLVPSTLPWHRR
jgi:hypothetical protein